MSRASIERVGQAEAPAPNTVTWYQLYQGFRDDKSFMLRIRAHPPLSPPDPTFSYALDLFVNAEWKCLHTFSVYPETRPENPMVGSAIATMEAIALKFLSADWVLEQTAGKLTVDLRRDPTQIKV